MKGTICPKNLRTANHSQNQQNSISTKGTSKHKGVSWSKKVGRWVAQIKKNYKTYWLGYFDDEADAAAAYNQKAKEMFGEYARLNDV